MRNNLRREWRLRCSIVGVVHREERKKHSRDREYDHDPHPVHLFRLDRLGGELRSCPVSSYFCTKASRTLFTSAAWVHSMPWGAPSIS